MINKDKRGLDKQLLLTDNFHTPYFSRMKTSNNDSLITDPLLCYSCFTKQHWIWSAGSRYSRSILNTKYLWFPLAS